VTAGWYIDANPVNCVDVDLHQRLSCDRKRPEGKQVHAYLGVGGGKRPLDRPEFVTIGEPETGFAVRAVMTSKNTYAYRMAPGSSPILRLKRAFSNSNKALSIQRSSRFLQDSSRWTTSSALRQPSDLPVSPRISGKESRPSLAGLFNPE
jgi:hypothetical protein